MNFIRAMNFLFNNIHTILFLLGITIVLIAITLLCGAYVGLLALGTALIIIALLINQ